MQQRLITTEIIGEEYKKTNFRLLKEKRLFLENDMNVFMNACYDNIQIRKLINELNHNDFDFINSGDTKTSCFRSKNKVLKAKNIRQWR